MRDKTQFRLLVAAFVLVAVALPALARSAADKTARASMFFSHALKLGDHTLKPGQYSVQADGTKVTLLQNGKIVAEAPAQWVDSEQQAGSDSVIYENQQIREFRFKGKKEHLVVQQSS